MRAKLAGLLGLAVLLLGACGETTPPMPAPTPGPTATPAPSTAPPVATPSALAEPTASGGPAPVPMPTATAARLPVRASAGNLQVRLAPGRDGRLFAAVPDGKDTVLVALDRRGKPLPGWPLRLTRASDCRLLVDPATGSVRAACADGGRGQAIVWAFDERGTAPAGWPVVLPDSDVPTLRFVDGDLIGAAHGPDFAGWRLLAISPAGDVRAGPTFDVNAAGVAVGPDGTVFAVDHYESEIVAVSMDGPRPGWPVRATGWTSYPSVRTDGAVLVVSEGEVGGAVPDGTSQLLAFDPDGRPLEGWPVEIPVDTWRACPEGACAPLSPVVGPGGSAYIAVRLEAGAVAYALGPGGSTRAGWPYESDASLVTGWIGVSAGCELSVSPNADSPPLTGPDGALYLAQNTVGNVFAGGNRIVAIAPSGREKAGWPVTLAEKGAWFETFAVGDGGSVFGFAIEPAGTGPNACGQEQTVYSGTIAALDGHGDPIYTTALVVP